MHKSFLEFSVAKQIFKLIRTKIYFYNPKLLVKEHSVS
jgi:hypothetical protein